MVKVPEGRTTKQRLRGYCLNPECAEDPRLGRFEFEATEDNFACPKCSQDQPPMVGLLVLTHFLVPDAAGRISGGLNRRFRLACDSSRHYIATDTNLEAGTDAVFLANCPGCMESSEAKQLTKNKIFGAS